MSRAMSFMLLSALLSRVALAGTYYYVSTTGSDSNQGTLAKPFLTIQHAADIVNAGDTVIVENGTYSCSSCSGSGSTLVNITRGGTASNPVVFEAQNELGAVLDGLNNTTAEGWEVGANYITIRGFEIRGFSEIGIDNYRGGQYLTIIYNLIHDEGRYCTDTGLGLDGIFLSNSHVTIEQNAIYNIGRYATGENGCQNHTTYYESNDQGIYISGASDVSIYNNLFWNNVHGWSISVYPAAVDSLSIGNNSFALPNPVEPGFIGFFNASTAPVTNTKVYDNIFSQANTAAIYIDPADGKMPNGWSVAVTSNSTTAAFWSEYYNGTTVTYDATLTGWSFTSNQTGCSLTIGGINPRLSC